MAHSATFGRLLVGYLKGLGAAEPHAGAAAYYAALDQVASVSPEVAAAIVREYRDQRFSLKLIASENYSSLAT